MKTIQLTNLKISNFKGVKSFDRNFSSRTVISGANATGKTTLFDAFTWLLFGKNSEDKKDFGIKPLTSDNKPVHRVDIEVQATMVVSENNVPAAGDDVTLRRVMREKWVTRRGSAEEEFTGHETLYFWNDVPLSQAEYEMKVSSILGDTVQLFKLITNPFYFNSMKWQDRRGILVSMAGEIPTPERFAKLLKDIGNKTLDEYRKELAAKKKKLKIEVETIPARIDEVKRLKPVNQDWAAIEKELAETEASMRDTIEELTNSGKSYDLQNAQVLAYKKEVNAMKSKISEFEYEASTVFNRSLNNKRANIDRVNGEIQMLRDFIKRDQQTVQENEERIKNNERSMAELREEFYKVSENTFTFVIDENNMVCPTCHQHLPQSEIDNIEESAKLTWQKQQSIQLDAIRAAGLKLKEENEILHKMNLSRVTSSTDNINALLEEKETWEKAEIISSGKVLEGNKEYHDAKAQLAELEANPVQEAKYDRNTTDLKLRQSGYMDRINNLKATLSTREQIKASQDRESELLRQEKEYAQQLADMDKIEFQIQDYVKAQVDAVEAKVNEMFSGIRFKMFSDQINGGISETCETLVDGVPWQDANNAAKINSGLMIIDTLTRHFGVSAPIWVDNAESVNHVFHSEASQLILLYVTEDKVLTINK